MDHLASDHLYVKVAITPEEIIAAQELRYRVFYQEMGAIPTEEMRRLERDADKYDPYCHHLLVIDSSNNDVIGTYRVLSLEDALAHDIQLYSESEFDLTKLKATGKKIMEVSRSCVLKEYRTRQAINLLWQGIADLVVANQVDYLVGIPSLHGTDIKPHLDSLAYLKAFYTAPAAICPHALVPHAPIPEVDKSAIDPRREFVRLPPLLKGYLRLGAVVGDGFFIDHPFNTIDVMVIMPIADMDTRYHKHYIHKQDI